ncbi:MAG: hypothetical protein ACLTSX_02805 [Collinsella sp.]
MRVGMETSASPSRWATLPCRRVATSTLVGIILNLVLPQKGEAGA